jgi:hypothetical protein
MIAKFILVWLLSGAAVHMWRTAEKADRKWSTRLLKSVAYSAVIAGVLISIVMLINNISGI